MRVSEPDAIKQANFYLAVLTSPSHPTFGLASWSATHIGKSVAFFDLRYLEEDDPVLYLFEVVQSDNSVAGFIGICGSDALGTHLAFVHAVRGMELHQTVSLRASQIRQHRGDEGIQLVPVAYSYPKVGLAAVVGGTAVEVIDLLSGGIASVGDLQLNKNRQGLTAWSFWDEFPQSGPGGAKWKKASRAIDDIVSEVGKRFATRPMARTPFVTDPKEQLVDRLREGFSESPPATEEFVLPVAAVGQISDHHCAPTSLIMLFEYLYGRLLDQDEVGAVMGLTEYGATTDGQMVAYQNYFGQDFDVSLDELPTFATLENAIRGYLPVKSGIRGHARVACGIRRDYFVDRLTGAVRLESLLLRVNDPLPMGSGSMRWDNILTANLKDFILLKRK